MPSPVLAELLAVVVPPACVACRAALPRAELWLCASCTRALPWLPARGCPRCGLAAHRRGCPAAGAAFTRAWAPLAHDGVARELVAALKFRGALPVAALMAAHMAANLPGDLRAGAPAALVPVPSQAARARRRGFDPAGVLAAALAPRLGLPVWRCLRRRDRAGRQVGSSRGTAPPQRAAGDRAPRATTAASPAGRRRPHHGRDARRLRAGACRGRVR